MVLFIDESENDEFFIVAGLLVNSKEDIDQAYKRFKKGIGDIPLPKREKSILFTEFKSVLLDRRYRRIKRYMLEALNHIEHLIIYSCYIKQGLPFSQRFKEETYLLLLSNILSSIPEGVIVIFDAFSKPDFEKRIIERAGCYQHVQAISPKDSQKEAGLQFVDNICSVIRLHKSSSDVYHFYHLIEARAKEV